MVIQLPHPVTIEILLYLKALPSMENLFKLVLGDELLATMLLQACVQYCNIY